MDKIILLILVSVIGSVTKGNAQLQCYVCNDCPNPTELDSNLVQTCSSQATTTTTEATTTTTTTIPEDPTTQTTDTSVITQTTPNVPPTTTPQVPDDTTTTQTSDGGITTQTPPFTPPSTTTQVPVIPPNLLGHKYLQIIRQSLSGFQCFVVHRTVGDSVQINRGCVLARETREQTCADANSGSDPQFCELCTADGCNDIDSSVASKYAVSLAMLLSSLFVIFTIR